MPHLTVKKVGETELVVTRRFSAPPARIYSAHTDSDLLQRWLLGPDGWTMPECISDPRPGGRIRFTWQKDEQSFSLNGEYIELDPPHRTVHSEAFESDPPMDPTLVTTHFHPDGDGTLLEMTIRYSSAEAREAALATGMTDGMETSYARLEETI